MANLKNAEEEKRIKKAQVQVQAQKKRNVKEKIKNLVLKIKESRKDLLPLHHQALQAPKIKNAKIKINAIKRNTNTIRILKKNALGKGVNGIKKTASILFLKRCHGNSEGHKTSINNISLKEKISVSGRLLKNIVKKIRYNLKGNVGVKEAQAHHPKHQMRKNVKEKIKDLIRNTIKNMVIGMVTKNIDTTNLQVQMIKRFKLPWLVFKDYLKRWLKDLEVVNNNTNNILQIDKMKDSGLS